MAAKTMHPKKLRVMGDYGSAGIWVAETSGPFDTP